jgi:hypothetical protein
VSSIFPAIGAASWSIRANTVMPFALTAASSLFMVFLRPIAALDGRQSLRRHFRAPSLPGRGQKQD